MPRPKIDQQITFIYTDDLDRSAHFYETIMGLPLWRDQGGCRIYQVSAEGYLGVCQTGGAAKGTLTENPTNVILTLVTEEVDAWYAYLRAQGVTFTQTPEENPRYQIYHCFLRDPNGYLIEIQRFLT